jgi:hypothetical protein
VDDPKRNTWVAASQARMPYLNAVMCVQRDAFEKLILHTVRFRPEMKLSVYSLLFLAEVSAPRLLGVEVRPSDLSK